MTVSDEAITAAAKAAWARYGVRSEPGYVRTLLEAAAPHMLVETELMRWKLDALKEWSDAMIAASNSPQYGRDVRTLLEVGSMDEALNG